MRHYKTKTGVYLHCIEGGGQTTPLPERQHLFLVGGKDKPGVPYKGWKYLGFRVWNDWHSKGFEINFLGLNWYNETLKTKIEDDRGSKQNAV